MLILHRMDGEAVRIGENIRLVFRRRGKGTEIRVEAPREIRVVRDELAPLPEAQAAGVSPVSGSAAPEFPSSRPTAA